MLPAVCDRALKTRGNTPKYGLIFHSSFIGRAKQRNKGRISRYLANKCSIASRIDCFMDASTSAFGEKMKEQVGNMPLYVRGWAVWGRCAGPGHAMKPDCRIWTVMPCLSAEGLRTLGGAG